ncbi:protocadherin alpha-10-like isoform X10 [Pleurodeles waltl]|uniref:protocadherin alpha-10-like isoform X10 n=1 Tax=Pleurodeles waltl TaxID=8319 RepID=UPI003709B41C
MAVSFDRRSGKWRTLYLVWVLWCFNSVRGHLKYSVFEELAPGTTVGNIAKDLGLHPVQLNSRGLKLVSGDRKQPFQVNMSNGALFIAERVDREQVCGQSSACTLHYELVIENPLEMHRLEVEILDVNDNAPYFIEKEDILNISETAAPGTRFSLPRALDLDTGVNSLQGYALSPNSHFELKTNTNSGGRKSAELTLTHALDREIQPVHDLVVTAFDGGDPKRSGSTRILIRVTDSNDNVPTFDRPVYHVKLLEDAPIGATVIRLNATDLDEGKNAEVRYSFNKRVPRNIKNTFNIDEISGVVTLKSRVDFEDTTMYMFSVEALDKGPQAVAGLCEIVVEIIDVNDNPPVISITSLSSSVPEDAKPGTVIALLTVSDRDSGDNGQVVCTVPTTLPFQLLNPFNNHYSLILKDWLDRETAEEYNISITATDGGSPPLSTSTALTVRASDVNDNIPVFSQASYAVFVKENNVPGTHIFTVSAIDADLKENGYLTYSLLANTSVDSFVSINSENGKIYGLKSFDFEDTRRLQFQVQAKDSGVPSLSSKVSVEVFILDQNDNAPSILSPHPQKDYFGAHTIPPSVDRGHLVTKIRAFDRDSGYNAWLSYHIAQTKGTSFFKVGLYTGEVRTSRGVKELEGSQQSLFVIVKDHGEPALSSTVSLGITVMDATNDMHKQFKENQESGHSVPEVNLYLVISIAFISFVFLLTVIIFVALRIHKASADKAEYGQPPCSNQSWFYTQSNSYKVCLGDPCNSVLLFNSACPPQTDESRGNMTSLEGKTQQSIDDLLMLGENQQPKHPNPDWRYSASLRAGVQSSVHMEESAVLRGVPAGLEQQWPTVSSATTEPEGGGEVSPPVGAGVNSNSWTFKYGPGNPKQPAPVIPPDFPDNFIIPGSPAIISIRQDQPPSQTAEKGNFITFGKKEETKKKKKKKKGTTKTTDKKEKGNSTTDNSDQ